MKLPTKLILASFFVFIVVSIYNVKFVVKEIKSGIPGDQVVRRDTVVGDSDPLGKVKDENIVKSDNQNIDTTKNVDNKDVNTLLKNENNSQARTTASVQLSAGEINNLARSAIVNLYCTNILSEEPESGSGFFIDSRGVILTNAHVAIDFLLKQYESQNDVNCVVRSGGPAYPKYKAKILYISPKWIKSNKEYVLLGSVNTIEEDFALLKIDFALGTDVLPAKFPSLDLYSNELSELAGKFMFAGYPSQNLSAELVISNLYPTSSFSDLLLIDSKFKTLIFENSLFAQAGASGSPVLGGDGKVVGIITAADLDSKNKRTGRLMALSINAVNEWLKGETGKTLTEYLSGDLNKTADQFWDSTGRELEQVLNSHIKTKMLEI